MSPVNKRSRIKKSIFWGIPLLSIEILLFLIFYQAAAYIFVSMGFLIVLYLTFYGTYKFAIWWDENDASN